MNEERAPTPTPAPPRAPVKVLLIEDNLVEAMVFRRMLTSEETGGFVVEHADTLAGGWERLNAGDLGLVLLDLHLPDSTGWETFARTHRQFPEVPIIVLSSLDDANLEVRTVQEGAQDYLVKGQVDRRLLVRAIRYALERHQIERQLGQERDLLHALLNHLPERIYFKDAQSRFLRISREMAKLFQLANPAEALGKTDFDFFTTEHAQPAFDDEQEVMRTGQPLIGRVEKETLPDGRTDWVLTSKMPLRDKEGRIVGTFGVSRDITARKQMEEKLAAERNLLRNLIDHLPDYVYVKDAEGRYVVDNSTHTWFLGAGAPDQVVGKTAFDFYPPDLAATYHAEDMAVIQTGQPLINREEPALDRFGHPRWLLITKVPLHDTSGKITGLVSIGRDITARRRAEEQSQQVNAELRRANEALEKEVREHQRTEAALRNSEALYHSLVDTLPLNVLRKDLAGKVTFGNPQYCRTIGRPLREILGKTDYELFPKELADKYVQDDRKVIETAKVFEDIEEHQKPDGSKLFVHVLKAPVLNAREEVVGTQVIFWDVTARKTAEERLKQAYAELQQSNEALKAAQLQLIEAEKMQSVGRLAAGVAHEVKNPLAVLGLGMEYLSDNIKSADPNVAIVLADMREAMRRADAIILGLLDFSAPSTLQLQEENLNQIVEQALGLVRHELGSAEIQVVRHLAPDLPAVRLDWNKITQVLVNLLTNAIHAMARGGALTVRTYLKQLQDHEIDRDAGSRLAERFRAGDLVAVAEVEDNGHGISEEHLSLVFDPFFTTKPTGKGTGLGLTVSRKIIELHGGSLELCNRPTGGVRATLIFKTQP